MAETVETRLERAMARLLDGDVEAALDELLEAWRLGRAAELVPLIDAVAAQAGAGRGRVTRRDKWLQLERARRPADLSRLMAPLEQARWLPPEDRQRLRQWPADPRIARHFGDEVEAGQPLSPVAAALAARIAAPYAAARRLETELLRAIADHPDDDGPRLVYADWLVERGDPRGELIALQCRRGMGPALRPEDDARERKLLERYERQWLGPLVRPPVRWERGFVASATLSPPIEAAIGAAEWSTMQQFVVGLQQLEVGHVDGAQVARLLDRRLMPSLRTVTMLPDTALARLCERGQPLPWQRLAVVGDGHDPLLVRELLRDCAALLPSLRHLRVRAVGQPEWIWSLLPQLDELTAVDDFHVVASWLRELGTHPQRLQRFRFELPYRTMPLVFSVGPDERLSRLVVPPTEATFAERSSLLRTLPTDALTELRVETNQLGRPTVEERRELEEAAARQIDLRSFELVDIPIRYSGGRIEQ